MSEALITQWRDRVLETEMQINVAQEDIDAVAQSRKALKHKIRKYEESVQHEKEELLRRLEEVEAEANDLAARCEATVASKDKVEAIYVATLDEYEAMHFLVHEIKDEEAMLSQREDLELRLQRESLAWAEEEHSLRTKLGHLETQLKQTGKQQQAERAELEAELAAMEKRQREERAKRTGEVRQKVRSVVRSSRQPTPLASSHHGSTAMSGVTSTDTDARYSNNTNNSSGGGSSKEDAFLAQNASSGVPTRQAPLRSCLKSSAADCAGTGSGMTVHSAPARAVSQALVSDNAGSSLSGAEGVRPPLEALQQMRAYSNGSGKQPQRKRDFLGDATNQ